VPGQAAALAVALAAGGVPAAAQAQPLQTLHVRAFSVAATPSTVRVGETFRLVITIRVDENVSSIDNVHLPDTSGFTEAGDERHLTSGGNGTSYTETLTLSANDPGLKTIGGASFEAIDAGNRTASRFKSNDATIRVLPPLASGMDGFWLQPVLDELRRLFGMLLRLLVVAAALILAARFFLRRRRAVAPPTEIAPPPVAPPALVPVNALARLRDLTTDLEADPTRRRAIEVRQYLRRCAGVRDDQTLADLEARLGGRAAPAFIAALRAAERAAFCEEARLPSAIAATVGALHALAAAPGALEVPA